MRLYLACCNGRHNIIEDHIGGDLKVYLAGVPPYREKGLYDKAILEHRPFILESYYYVDDHTERLLPYYGDFLLDSGAYTFMQNTKTEIHWEDYIKRYAKYVRDHKIKKYFELDIDGIVGYKKVLEYRKMLEDLVGWKSIPVWHNSRGKEEYEKSCQEYDYVAVGGLVDGGTSSEYARKNWFAFPWFVKTAHKHGAKIHALGFTSLDGIRRFHFDSVDSTSWTAGNRFGYLYFFNGKTMIKKDVPKGKRFAKERAGDVAIHNYLEWIKFQKYAEVKL